jgi:uncharacterized membrane protein
MDLAIHQTPPRLATTEAGVSGIAVRHDERLFALESRASFGRDVHRSSAQRHSQPNLLPPAIPMVMESSSHSSAEPPYHAPSSVEELTAQNVKSIADLERAAKHGVTATDRLADGITRFCGSMTFFWVHVVFFTLWIAGNTLLPVPPLDPFPFSFLTLVVSLEAIFLSTFIMIAENRQERLDERRSHLDLQINLLAEQENTKMLRLLEQIARKVGVDPSDDPDIAVLEQATRPEELAKQIDESEKRTERDREKH